MVVAAGIAIALFPPLTAADLYLSADRSGILPVNATAITFLCLASVFGLILLFALAHDRGRNLCLTYLATAPVLSAFALLTMVRLAGGFLPGAYWEGDGKFVYLPLFDFVVLIFAVGIASVPAFRQYHRAILIVCLLAAAGSIFVDVFYPGTFSKLYTRPAGFMKNPNSGAATATILAIAAVDWTRSRASDMLLWVIAGTAVVATLSRGGMVLFAVTFLLYNIVIARSGSQIYAKRLLMVLVAMAIVVGLYSIANLGSTVYSAENRRVQLLAALLSGESGVLTDDSRVELVSRYIDIISERPILGYGSGFATAQGKAPHNTFLLLWVENGIPGLACYVILLAVAFWHFRRRSDRRGQALCMATIILSAFSSDVLDMRPLIVALGLLSVLAGLEPLIRSERARSSATRILAKPLGQQSDRNPTFRRASGATFAR
jgi:O-antigen ligase